MTQTQLPLLSELSKSLDSLHDSSNFKQVGSLQNGEKRELGNSGSYLRTLKLVYVRGKGTCTEAHCGFGGFQKQASAHVPGLPRAGGLEMVETGMYYLPLNKILVCVHSVEWWILPSSNWRKQCNCVYFLLGLIITFHWYKYLINVRHIQRYIFS